MSDRESLLLDAAREARAVLEEVRSFIVANNRLVEHARKEPVNTTWDGVHRRRTSDVARAIDGVDALLREALGGSGEIVHVSGVTRASDHGIGTAIRGRVRSTLAGWLFLLAGKLDRAYDVWLDDAPRKERT